MKNRRLLALLLGALLPLSSCTLFNDDDLAFENHYNPVTETRDDGNPDGIKVNNVLGVKTEYVENTMLFRDVFYGNSDGKVLNTYKTDGVNHNEFNVNGNKDYDADYDDNVYDLYVPDTVKSNLVLLFIHGGSWVMGDKVDMNQYAHEFASKGYITATMSYTLLSIDSLKNDVEKPNLSIFRDLDEIDACIASIKSGLAGLNKVDVNKLKLVIGGGSSGSHLTMLYTYSRGDKSPIPIKFIMNAVGPVAIKQDTWKSFKTDEEDACVEQGLEKEALAANASKLDQLKISGTSFYWNEYETMRIANGMCGFPGTSEEIVSSANSEKTLIEHPNTKTKAMTNAGGGEDQLSIPYWINKNYIDGKEKIKMVCAYAGRDKVVGVNQFATLQTALENAEYVNGTDYKYVYFKNCGHTDIKASSDETAYNQLLTYLDEWCEADF